MAVKTNGEVKWRKVLYEDQNVPDNYVDKSFLTEMKKNIYVRSYNYWDLVGQTAVLSQQICSVCCLVLCWWLMDEGRLEPVTVIQYILPISLSSFLLYVVVIIDKGDRLGYMYQYLKTSVVVLCFTDFLSPVLKTLTNTISTDTIYAMAVFMILGHLLLNDYRMNAGLVSRAASLNMSLFSSVCLASRLDTSEHVFVIVILAVVLFGLWPILQRNLRCKTPGFQAPFTIGLVIVMFFLLTLIHVSVSAAFLAIVLFMSFVCPFLLMSLQSHKNNIYGPWDEAVIKPESPRFLGRGSPVEKKVN